MPIWDKSECETFFADGKVSATEPCQVRIESGRIVIDAGGWMYEGEEDGPNHFRLFSHLLAGKGSLHRFEGAEILDGWWREGSIYGMWRISLARADEEE